MPSSMAAWLLAAGCLYLLWSGIRFHRGPNRRDLRVYRSRTLPRILRHFDLVAPVSMGLLLPSIVGAAVVLGTPVGEGPSHQMRGVGLVGAGYFLFSLAVISILLFRPPDRLIPRWLVEDDSRVGYVAPPPGLEDRFWLVAIAVPATLIAIAAVALGVRTFLVGP